MVGTFGCFDLLREIAGQFNFETAGESGFPCDQLPVASVLYLYCQPCRQQYNYELEPGDESVPPRGFRCLPLCNQH